MMKESLASITFSGHVTYVRGQIDFFLRSLHPCMVPALPKLTKNRRLPALRFCTKVIPRSTLWGWSKQQV